MNVVKHLWLVFMPLFKSVADHWLLFVGVVKKRHFLVYESLCTKRDAPRQQLVLSVKVAVSLALMRVAEFTDVLK